MDVITHPDVDAVWICSPSQFHADQVRPPPPTYLFLLVVNQRSLSLYIL